MTVINAMRFNAKEGAIVADEQASGSGRKYDGATKIYEPFPQKEGGMIFLLGGTGASTILYNAFLRLTELFQEQSDQFTSRTDLAEATVQVMREIKRKCINDYCQTVWGLSEIELQNGNRRMPDGSSLSLTPDILNRYIQAITDRTGPLEWVHNNQFVALVLDPSGINLYGISADGAYIVPHSYCTVGSGADAADHTLSTFTAGLTREGKESINPVQGVAALLYATESASQHNMGVGGTPLIRIIKDGKVLRPSEDASHLAAEIVKASRAGFLKNGFECEALEKLLFQEGANFDALEEEMKRKATDAKRLDRFLRGYKV